MIEFVSEHPFISLGISHSFIFVAGYLLNHIRVGFKTNKLWDEWEASAEDPLYKEYLESPIKDVTIPRDEDDWTGYTQAVRPTIQVGVRPSHDVPTRRFDTYLANLPVQREAAPTNSPVSPAMVAYFGTPGYVGQHSGYVGRHSAEGRTEAQIRALNTSTGTMPVINPNATRVLAPNWREQTVPHVRELEPV